LGYQAAKAFARKCARPFDGPDGDGVVEDLRSSSAWFWSGYQARAYGGRDDGPASLDEDAAHLRSALAPRGAWCVGKRGVRETIAQLASPLSTRHRSVHGVPAGRLFGEVDGEPALQTSDASARISPGYTVVPPPRLASFQWQVTPTTAGRRSHRDSSPNALANFVMRLSSALPFHEPEWSKATKERCAAAKPGHCPRWLM
jgi:hypothetical protein